MLTDLDRSPEWDPRVTKVTQMTRGPLRSGVILRGIFEVGGETYHADDEVTEFDPPWRFGLRSVQGGTDAISYTLSPEDHGSTRVDVVLEYVLPDIPAETGLDERQVRQQLSVGLNEALRSLKIVVERESGLLA